MIGWVPAVSALAVKFAVPAASTGTLVASGVPPSEKAMVPVVTGAPLEVTVAVNVTVAPTVEGFTSDASVVEVALAWTTWSRLPALVA